MLNAIRVVSCAPTTTGDRILERMACSALPPARLHPAPAEVPMFSWSVECEKGEAP